MNHEYKLKPYIEMTKQEYLRLLKLCRRFGYCGCYKDCKHMELYGCVFAWRKYFNE